MGLEYSIHDISQWFDNNLDPYTRTIYLGSLGSDLDDSESGMDWRISTLFVKAVHALESHNKKPITVIMNNPGGDWYHGMAVYDAITCSPCKFTVRVYGQAMSMGSIILQAADYREMMPNSRFMFHYGSEGLSGHSKTVERWADESRRIARRMENIYLDRIVQRAEEHDLRPVIKSIFKRLSEFNPAGTKKIGLKLGTSSWLEREDLREVLSSLLMFDTILTPEETVGLGLADTIIKINKKNKIR